MRLLAAVNKYDWLLMRKGLQFFVRRLLVLTITLLTVLFAYYFALRIIIGLSNLWSDGRRQRWEKEENERFSFIKLIGRKPNNYNDPSSSNTRCVDIWSEASNEADGLITGFNRHITRSPSAIESPMFIRRFLSTSCMKKAKI